MRIVVSKPWGFAAPKIMQGFIDAFLEEGHDVHVIRNQDFFMQKQAEEQIRKIINFKPDFALGYGFSALLCIENTHLFSALKVPTVHYFADDPFDPRTSKDFDFVIHDPFTSIWVWDKSYIGPLMDTGFRSVHYLPLAANTNIFRKLEPGDYEKLEYCCNISFAGNHGIESRLTYLEKLTDIGLAIYGDEKRWRKCAKHSPVYQSYRGFLRREEELCELYNTAVINLNMTVDQGKTSANFRIFNVTACGGFLLSDYKKDIEDLFEIDREVVCYRTPDELREKAEYYLAHPDELSEIAEAGYKRTVRDHTFAKRVRLILSFIEEKTVPIEGMAEAIKA